MRILRSHCRDKHRWVSSFTPFPHPLPPLPAGIGSYEPQAHLDFFISLIAIMLGRLQMSSEKHWPYIDSFFEKIFSPRTKCLQVVGSEERQSLSRAGFESRLCKNLLCVRTKETPCATPKREIEDACSYARGPPMQKTAFIDGFDRMKPVTTELRYLRQETDASRQTKILTKRIGLQDMASSAGNYCGAFHFEPLRWSSMAKARVTSMPPWDANNPPNELLHRGCQSLWEGAPGWLHRGVSGTGTKSLPPRSRPAIRRHWIRKMGMEELPMS